MKVLQLSKPQSEADIFGCKIVFSSRSHALRFQVSVRSVRDKINNYWFQNTS